MEINKNVIQSENQLDVFKMMFEGRDNAYGLYDPKTNSYRAGKNTLTKQLYRDHLEGKISLGVYPINEENKCHFGVIDDDYHHKNKTYNF